jgi:hypothetical protein
MKTANANGNDAGLDTRAVIAWRIQFRRELREVLLMLAYCVSDCGSVPINASNRCEGR